MFEADQQPEAARGALPPAIVRHFRKIAIWPLQIEMPDQNSRRRNAEALSAALDKAHWKLVEDEFGSAIEPLEERHYREFVSFLPHVQRFLYGDEPGPVRNLAYGDAPLRIYRRSDITGVRIWMTATSTPILCKIAHIDLHFFYDTDIAILACEIEADDVPLPVASEIMYRFGRAYPSGWTATGEPLNTTAKVEWLAVDGSVLAASDYDNKDRYLKAVGFSRAPCVGKHWEYVLQPLVPASAQNEGRPCFRQIEYYRMPSMSFLSLERLSDLSQDDIMRLAFMSGTGPKQRSQAIAADFERRGCYDFLHQPQGAASAANVRFLVGGHGLTMLVDGDRTLTEDRERGLLAQFRHQYYLLFLISHFHKAAMLMISDQLVAAVKPLAETSERTVTTFRNRIYRLQENFMRFTQRYWFTEISDQIQIRDLFRMQTEKLGNERLYSEIRHELFDLVQYLDSDVLRRQSGTMHRLTAVTIVGLIGTVVTGFLGMNLIAAADQPMDYKLGFFGIVSALVIGLTIAVIVYSKRLTDWFDRMSGER